MTAIRKEKSVDLKKRIELGLLVCPKTKQRLSISHDNQWLENVDKTEHYNLLNGAIPILLIYTKWAEKYANDSKVMNKEYDISSINKSKSLFNRIKAKLMQDYRTIWKPEEI
jgi:uncharacterized protein YbaR (Trm112 family)